MIISVALSRDSQRKLAVLAVVGVLALHAATLTHFIHDISSGRPDFARLYLGAKLMVPRGGAISTIAGPPDTLHAPFEKLALSPLTLLPYRAAYFVWYLCNALMLGGVLWLLRKRLAHAKTPVAWLIIAAGTFYPVLVALVQGQDSILLLLLLTFFVVSMEKGHQFRAGVVLALCMFKFMIVLPVVGALVFARKWKCSAGFLAGMAALTLITAAAIGPSGISGYFTTLFQFSRSAPQTTGDAPYVMPNLRGLLIAVASNHLSRIEVTAIALSAAISIFAIVSRRVAASRERLTALHLSAIIVMAILVAYHLYTHDLAILVLPLLVATSHFAAGNNHSTNRIIFYTAAAALYSAPLIAPSYISMPALFFSILLLQVALYREIGREPGTVPFSTETAVDGNGALVPPPHAAIPEIRR